MILSTEATSIAQEIEREKANETLDRAKKARIIEKLGEEQHISRDEVEHLLCRVWDVSIEP